MYVATAAFLLTFLPAISKKMFGVKIPAAVEIMTIFSIYGFLFIGEVRGLYADYLWWDSLLNVISAIALGFIGFTVMYSLYKEDIIDSSPFVIAAASFCFAVAAGAIWEIFEFGMDSLFGFAMQKSGEDTMNDILSNAFGAFVVSLGGYFYLKSGKEGLLSSFVLRLMERNPKVFKANKGIIDNSEKRISELIKKGESHEMEFKSSLRKNLYTNQFDKKIEHSVLKTIVAYLNSHAGTLLVGVSNKGEIIGTGIDGFENNDRLSLHLTNLIKQNIGGEYLPFIKHQIIPLNGKNVVKIDCMPSNRHVFLKNGKEEEFYVRNGPSSARLDGSALVDYIHHKFNSSGNL